MNISLGRVIVGQGILEAVQGVQGNTLFIVVVAIEQSGGNQSGGNECQGDLGLMLECCR